MKLKKVYVMSGPPGCGKSTWIQNHLTEKDVWISRDVIRFSMLKDGEDYFSHEDQVFCTFMDHIRSALAADEVEKIYVDATHLNKRSRQKVASRIDRTNIEEMNCVCFNVPTAVCLERNNLRTGLAHVPENAIYNMANVYFYPGRNERFDHVYEVNVDNEMKEVEMK